MNLIDFCIKLFSYKNKSFLGRFFHFDSLLRRLAVFIVNKALYVLLVPRAIDNNKPREEDLIVSLTSIPSRIDRLWMVIESMMRQTIRPASINLYLSYDQFPQGEQELPQSLLSYKSKGLNIVFVKEDLRSHKKYYYAIKQFPMQYLVTIDDDILYYSTLLEGLYNKAKEDRSVVCNWGRIPLYKDNKLLPYNDWPLLSKETYSKAQRIFLLSGGGTIFPPNSLYKDVVEKTLFLQLTPLADDIWLNAMVQIQGSNINFRSSKEKFVPLKDKHDDGLWKANMVENKNDLQICQVADYYKEKGFDLFS